jgi:hypothetical protein
MVREEDDKKSNRILDTVYGAKCPIKHLWAFVSSHVTLQDPSWHSVLSEALAQAPNEPQQGTSFRALVDRVAATHGLAYPPANEPNLRFVQLLQRYPDILTVVRRPGQDMLVIPAGRTDLLASKPQMLSLRIREDLFGAFTQIRSGMPVYDRDTDTVTWQPEEAVLPDGGVRIPKATQQGEIELRRQFSESAPADDVKSRLYEALNSSSPFYTFGKEVREMGLQPKWHVFRTERIREKMEAWANDAGLTWKDAWFTRGRHERIPTRTATASNTTQVEALTKLLTRLGSADLQRISVPLDLVLKALQQPNLP